MQIVCMRKVTNIRTITFNFQKHNKVAYRSYRWVANSTLNFHFIFLLQEALSATHMSELLRLQQGACINQSSAIHSSSVPFLRMVCSFAKQSVTLRWKRYSTIIQYTQSSCRDFKVPQRVIVMSNYKNICARRYQSPGMHSSS